MNADREQALLDTLTQIDKSLKKLTLAMERLSLAVQRIPSRRWP